MLQGGFQATNMTINFIKKKQKGINKYCQLALKESTIRKREMSLMTVNKK